LTPRFASSAPAARPRPRACPPATPGCMSRSSTGIACRSSRKADGWDSLPPRRRRRPRRAAPAHASPTRLRRRTWNGGSAAFGASRAEASVCLRHPPINARPACPRNSPTSRVIACLFTSLPTSFAKSFAELAIASPKFLPPVSASLATRADGTAFILSSDFGVRTYLNGETSSAPPDEIIIRKPQKRVAHEIVGFLLLLGINVQHDLPECVQYRD
jgi:hypothetical protein